MSSSESRLAGRMPCARRPRPQRSPPALSHPTPAPPHALAEHRPHIRTTRPPRHAYPSLTLRRSLIYPPFLSHPPRTALHPSRATRTSPAPSPPVCTRIRRPLPRRSSHVPSAHRTSVPHAPATTARLPAEVLKLQDFSFYQSISSFVVSLPNLSEKDVKGLLFRKQPLHTSPNRSKKGEAGASRLSSLRNLTSPPRLCPQMQNQNECSKPERFDELTLA